MRNLLIFLENFLPASQAFVAAQARSFSRYHPDFLVGRRESLLHDAGSRASIHEIRSSKAMRVGELLLKTTRTPVPRLFPSVQKADLIHAHFGKNGYILGPLAKAAAKPLVTTFHGFDATYSGDPHAPGGFNQVRFFASGRAQMANSQGFHIAVSDFIRDRMLALGFPERSIFRHYIGIDTSLFSPPLAPRRPGLVVSVARFVEYKGHRYLIEALERVSKQGVPVELVMVGEGPLRTEIEALARRALPKVEIREKQSQMQIRDLLAQACLYVHTAITLENGHAEAFGLANLEAEAMGTPVVAFRSGGVGEAVEDGRTGLLARERDVPEMADAIGKLLTNPDLWNAFSSRAPQMVAERFDLRRQSKLLEDYYDEVIDLYARKRSA